MKPSELNKTEYEKLIACYKDGLIRMQTIFCQEVLQNETRNTTGRRVLGVRKMKYKDYLTQNKMDKEKNASIKNLKKII